ncbi:MAG TPA: L,D-transpeptidase [Ectothiorhodospiraceae bacterium]|nr:L,D-transpeptidase [Ectothiorhodospiraceae bacterium]
MAESLITINIAAQRLRLEQGGELVMDVAVSTATNGPGERNGSECTPRGQHYIRARIGEGCEPNSVFIARRPTGEVFTEALRAQHPARDWILSRILWLCGMESGSNRGGNVDTMRRYVYIHGCPDSDSMGIPGSHGCVKMRNHDIIKLFDRVETGTRVLITEK